MNAIAVDDVPATTTDTYGGLLREGETPEHALRRLEKKSNYARVIGSDEGQRLLAAATAQVNAGRKAAAKPARPVVTPAAEPEPLLCVGSVHVPGHSEGCPRVREIALAVDADAVRAIEASATASPDRVATSPVGPQLLDLPLNLIDIGENVRRDAGDLEGLASSIVELGLQQPVTVTPAAGGRYTLLLGQRRVLASRLAEQTNIRAIVLADPTDVLAKPGARRASEQVAENRVRLAMNPVDEAVALRAILDGDKTLNQVTLAKRIGMSEPWITSTLALLKAPAEVQAFVREDKLSIAHAKAIAGLPAADQVRLAKSAIQNGVSAHSLEDTAKWERSRQQDTKDRSAMTTKAAERGLATLAKAGTAKDARLFVVTDHWQIQDADVRKVIKAAGYQVDEGWARTGDRWSKCDCTALYLRIRDGEGSTLTTVCVSDAHERAWEKERNAKAAEKQAAEQAERKSLVALVRAAMPTDLNPTVGRLILRVLDGYSAKAWAEYSKIGEVGRALADRITSEQALRGGYDSKGAVPVKTLIKELGGESAPAAAPGAKHPRRRPPSELAARSDA